MDNTVLGCHRLCLPTKFVAVDSITRWTTLRDLSPEAPCCNRSNSEPEFVFYSGSGPDQSDNAIRFPILAVFEPLISV